MHDCLIIGGGVIGLSIAWELTRHGVTAVVLEQGEFGRESSWAGAGMLPPGRVDSARTPESLLRSHSHALWPTWSAELREVTGIDNGFQRRGGLEIRMEGPSDELDDEIRSWLSAGVECQPLSGEAVRELEPELRADLSAAYLLPEMGQVRNPRHIKALLAGCLARGVTLIGGTPVTQLIREGNRVVRVETPSESFCAKEIVVAGGAWSERLLAQTGSAPWIRSYCSTSFPIRGVG
ncbi:MAG: FAD-dependent oxidoreductase [Planctomycetota bacterium]|nr:FAD-dependent oxidoreductase [Planctomycetota bacterium]